MQIALWAYANLDSGWQGKSANILATSQSNISSLNLLLIKSNSEAMTVSVLEMLNEMAKLLSMLKAWPFKRNADQKLTL